MCTSEGTQILLCAPKHTDYARFFGTSTGCLLNPFIHYHGLSSSYARQRI